MNELFLSSLLPLQLVRARGDFYIQIIDFVSKNHYICRVLETK